MDSGNLIFSDDDDDDQSVTSHWESFQNPTTDTFLPGMNIDEFPSLTSWKRDGDPGQGQFTFKQDQAESNYIISEKQERGYWRSSWIGSSPDDTPNDIVSLLSNWSNIGNYSYERLVMNYTGELQYYRSSGVDQGNWSSIWRKPDDKYCSIYNFCGNFGSCNINNSPIVCKCLPGFHPTNPWNWNSRDFSDGCTRNSTSLDKSDMSLSLKMMQVSKPELSLDSIGNETYCRKKCLTNSQCRTYSYGYLDLIQKNYDSFFLACNIWISDLSDLQDRGAHKRS
ncbi:G-type lectin S-receptor-like serine/threonine-protein kinase At4g03230 [Corylus avellana]|uniref:G-type lectin S-receptor-like serine/threonine-protein kinase At4g03230 n=1 Tax=Corylus avellana TaxID=13451 RepID=UPI00286CDD53|nr:G-type lectin S-receptor-like serine/threonine-protein kinase At4g03230 [Corylus avellana]